MYRRQQAQSEYSFAGEILKIAIGVFIGSLAAVFTYEAVLAWRVEQVAKKVSKELAEAQLKIEAALRQSQQERAAEQEGTSQNLPSCPEPNDDSDTVRA